MLNSDNKNMDVLHTTVTTTTVNSALSAEEEETESNEAPPDPFEILRQQCYERLNQTDATATTENTIAGKYCPGTFDGWLCWPDTAAGTSAYERCPEFITGFDPLSKYNHKNYIQTSICNHHENI
ncbi:hypothetical protein DOY81_013104 [Sarcophaga bullata]|nr:hypothetical protein DOY81_013104 [Sarcophaga bullata]